MRVSSRNDLAVDRESGPGHRLFGKQGTQLGRQGEVAQAHAAHNVVENARVTRGEAVRDISHRMPHAAGRQAGPIGSKVL
jgi:hypothetical protein